MPVHTNQQSSASESARGKGTQGTKRPREEAGQDADLRERPSARAKEEPTRKAGHQAEDGATHHEGTGKDRKEVSQERLSQLAKARSRALEVRKERSGLKKKEKELKDKFYTNKRIELDSFERHLNKRAVQNKDASDDEGSEDVHARTVKQPRHPPAQRKSKQRHKAEVVCDGSSSDYEEEPEQKASPRQIRRAYENIPPARLQASPPPRQQTHQPAPRQQQQREKQPESDNAGREADAYTLDAYKRKMAEAKRAMLYDAVFG